MYEIRIHGRGGQGAVLAAKILAKAIVEEGKVVKAIPAFGFERRGAPVAAFLRFDDKPIRYKKLKTGFVTYSIGIDSIDDGGRERSRGARGSVTYDWTFIIER